MVRSEFSKDSPSSNASHSAEAEQALGLPKEGESWLHSVVHNSTEIIQIIDPDGTLRYANLAFERVLGYNPKEATGMNVLEHVHPDDLPHVLEEAEKALGQTGVARNTAEFRFRHKDGSWRYMESVGTYLLDDPAVGGVVVNSRDVTERKRAEEDLRKTQEFITSILDNAPFPIYIVSEDGQMRLVNRFLAELVSMTQEEVIGSSLEDVFTEEEARQFRETNEKVVETKTPVIVDEWIEDSNGWRNFQTVKFPLRDLDRGADAIGGISVEFTERKRVEESVGKSEERYRALTQNSSDIVTLLGADGTIHYQSPSVERILGYRSEELLGENVFGYVHPEDLPRVRGEFMRGLSEPEHVPSAEYRLRHKDGSWVWLESIGNNLLDDPKVGEFVINSRDITERKRAEELLHRAEARYRTLVERMPAVTYVQEISSPDSAVYMSPQIEILTGYTPEECKDPDLRWRMVHPDDRERMQAQDKRLVEPGEIVTNEYRVIHREGRTVWVRNESILIEEAESGSRYWQGFMTDITERKQAEARLQYQVNHDLLTNLPNRQLFLARLEQALRRTRKHPASEEPAVLFVDLDNFKVVNDSLGHEVGDLLLVRVGERLRRCLRSEDTLSRFGGDEFAILLENMQSPKDAVRAAERIIEELRKPLMFGGRELVLRASVGIALGQDRSKTPGELLKDADTAMYRAKEDGVGYRVFEPKMYEQALRRLKMENDLRRAIEAKEFVVHYQPIVNLRTGEAWGSEALVRWKHPERGLLAPSQFVPVAEETGLIVPLGEMVLEEACYQAAEWQRGRPEAIPPVVCVNLSARQLGHQGLADTVERVLRSTGLNGRCLCLDITETLYLTVLESDTAVLKDLKQMGIRMSVDDFGVGYSSLSYLKRLPTDTLKVDKSFVAGLGEDVQDTAIVQMVIGLAHSLGMGVVAEGVESQKQAKQLKEMGCDLGQGYYFAKPLPPEGVTEFLSR